MEVTLAALADFANTTDHGKVNVIGIFQKIYSPAVPFEHHHCFLVVLLQANPSEKGDGENIDA